MRRYAILHSAGLGGTTFSGVSTSNVPADFTASLSYTGTDAILKFTANMGGPSAGGPGDALVGLSENQQAVANAIDNFFNNGGDAAAQFLALFNLTGANLANALTLLSGEPPPARSGGAFQLMNEFLADARSVRGWSRRVGGAYGQAARIRARSRAAARGHRAAYAKVLRTPVYKAIPFEQRWSVSGGGLRRLQQNQRRSHRRGKP